MAGGCRWSLCWPLSWRSQEDKPCRLLGFLSLMVVKRLPQRWPLHLFSSPNLFLNVLPRSKWPGVTRFRGARLKSPDRLDAFCCNTLASIQTRFLCVSSTPVKRLFPPHERLSDTMAVTFAVWGARAKLAQISFSCFTVSRMGDRFSPWSSAHDVCSLP